MSAWQRSTRAQRRHPRPGPTVALAWSRPAGEPSGYLVVMLSVAAVDEPDALLAH